MLDERYTAAAENKEIETKRLDGMFSTELRKKAHRDAETIPMKSKKQKTNVSDRHWPVA